MDQEEERAETSVSFGQSKLARKKAEEDAKLLQTRIQLLKKEEQKVGAQDPGLEKNRGDQEAS